MGGAQYLPRRAADDETGDTHPPGGAQQDQVRLELACQLRDDRPRLSFDEVHARPIQRSPIEGHQPADPRLVACL